MIKVDVRNGIPIYKQIVEGMKEKIISGDLNEDDKIPSIRALAGSLRINPNTIKKAYTQLEVEGFIYTVTGLGCFVKPIVKEVYETQLKEIQVSLEVIIEKAKLNKVNKEKLIDIINTMYEE